ncbi:MAG: FecR domain-containing protein [Candidatus Riflebacteria bacterium]
MKFFFTILSGFILLLGCSAEQADVCRLKSFTGEVEVSADKNDFKPAANGQLMAAGSEIRVRKNSSALLEFIQNSGTLTLKENSFFEVKAGNCLGNQKAGMASYDINKKQTEIVIETPHGTTAILGTKFVQSVTESSFDLWVADGKVSFTTAGKSKIIEAGSKIHFQKNSQLEEPQPIPLPEKAKIFMKGDGKVNINRR